MARSRHGRPELSAAAVAEAGRRIIERDGLDALSMRAVAHELDTAATSLYRHVADRDALLLAILEDVAASLPVEVPGRTPRARLLRRLAGAHDYMARSVWVLHILIRGELVAENAFAFSDACIQDLLDAGLTPRAASTAYRACWHLIIGELLDEHPLTPPREPSQRSEAVRRMDAARYPALAGLRAPDSPGRDDMTAVLEKVVDAFLPVSSGP
jgi:AcrR family transcriptional regulator